MVTLTHRGSPRRVRGVRPSTLGFALLFVTHDDALGRHVAPRETLVIEGDKPGP